MTNAHGLVALGTLPAGMTLTGAITYLRATWHRWAGTDSPHAVHIEPPDSVAATVSYALKAHPGGRKGRHVSCEFEPFEDGLPRDLRTLLEVDEQNEHVLSEACRTGRPPTASSACRKVIDRLLRAGVRDLQPELAAYVRAGAFKWSTVYRVKKELGAGPRTRVAGRFAAGAWPAHIKDELFPGEAVVAHALGDGPVRVIRGDGRDSAERTGPGRRHTRAGLPGYV